MEIEIRQVGKSMGRPAIFIELTVSCDGSTICTDITSLNGLVDENLIANLRDIADDLEEQNKLVKEKDS